MIVSPASTTTTTAAAAADGGGGPAGNLVNDLFRLKLVRSNLYGVRAQEPPKLEAKRKTHVRKAIANGERAAEQTPVAEKHVRASTAGGERGIPPQVSRAGESNTLLPKLFSLAPSQGWDGNNSKITHPGRGVRVVLECHTFRIARHCKRQGDFRARSSSETVSETRRCSACPPTNPRYEAHTSLKTPGEHSVVARGYEGPVPCFVILRSGVTSPALSYLSEAAVDTSLHENPIPPPKRPPPN